MQQRSAKAVDVLVIDDDKLSQKIIKQTLIERNLDVRLAHDGETGLQEAWRMPPDIILLDVEMPGLNGYEVCDRLRGSDVTHEIPIIFLSGCTSLRERMLGYEAGADDYMGKPFEAQDLIARITVLLKYREQRGELQAQYELAHKAAMAAMRGTSELSQALQFMERSFRYITIDQLAEGILETIDRLSLNACLLIMQEDQFRWDASDGNIKPLEQELMLMADPKSRFLDFGSRTLVNFSGLRLLVRNMPLDDMERYGRIKDLLPVLMSAARARITSLQTLEALSMQNQDLLRSFGRMRSNLFSLVKTLVDNRNQSKTLATNTIYGLNGDLLRMGLEEDQETYLLGRVESTMEKVIEQMDAGSQIRDALTVVLSDMRDIVNCQQRLVEAFSDSQKAEPETLAPASGDIELF